MNTITFIFWSIFWGIDEVFQFCKGWFTGEGGSDMT
jgi:hypothetical protein